MGIIAFILIFIPIVVKLLGMLIAFEIKSISACFAILFCLCWPCCLCGLFFSLIFKAASKPEEHEEGKHAAVHKEEEKITCREICCLLFFFRGNGMESTSHNKVHSEF